MTLTFYQVGGSVRDELLGIKPSDTDFAVEVKDPPTGVDPYDIMYEAIKGRVRDRDIYLMDRNKSLIKARWDFKESIDGAESSFITCRTCDFALIKGSILDHLSKTDFTINAMAKCEDGTIIDPYNGMRNIKGRTLYCVGEPTKCFTDSPIRLLRAIRLQITKELSLSHDIVDCLSKRSFWEPRLRSITQEVIREELRKCFIYDTPRTLAVLDLFRSLRVWLFSPRDGARNLWLFPSIGDR